MLDLRLEVCSLLHLLIDLLLKTDSHVPDELLVVVSMGWRLTELLEEVLFLVFKVMLVLPAMSELLLQLVNVALEIADSLLGLSFFGIHF